MSKHEIGLKRMQDILGGNAKELLKKFNEISPDFANYIIEFAYGDLYARAGLNDKSREIAAVACIIGQGNTGTPLRAHINGMLNVGWSKHEILELLILLIGYVGFPTAVDAIFVAQEVFTARDNTHK